MPFPPLVEIESRVQGTTRVVAVRGEIDSASADKVGRAVDEALAARPETIVLDLSAVGFCDSSGIHLVVRSHRRAAAHGGRLVVVRPSGAAWRPFEVCQIEREVRFVDAGDAADGDSTEAAGAAS